MQETPKRKTSTKNDVSNRKTTPRSKRAAASAKPIRDESSGENESEDDEPLSKKAKPSPPTVSRNCIRNLSFNYQCHNSYMNKYNIINTFGLTGRRNKKNCQRHIGQSQLGRNHNENGLPTRLFQIS